MFSCRPWPVWEVKGLTIWEQLNHSAYHAKKAILFNNYGHVFLFDGTWRQYTRIAWFSVFLLTKCRVLKCEVRLSFLLKLLRLYYGKLEVTSITWSFRVYRWTTRIIMGSDIVPSIFPLSFQRTLVKNRLLKITDDLLTQQNFIVILALPGYLSDVPLNPLAASHFSLEV